MMTSIVAKKTKEVLDRTERIRTFIDTNCNMYGIVNISIRDLNEISSIYITDIMDMYSSEDGKVFGMFNTHITDFTDSVIKYITKICDISVTKKTVNKEIYKLTKGFIFNAAKLFNMKSEDYIMYILLDK
jgi:ribosomal protein S3